ncbi:hypothetical protein E2C01_095593 [Portunus trituberculatus]|uniref:Uncharacterized protein n=1 Tax=Portunus trituberculatus TaxID=210409 RepID=A0A5B7JZ91_PORTR|nr:hypothetical protein [Portunus trituberculatus]
MDVNDQRISTQGQVLRGSGVVVVRVRTTRLSNTASSQSVGRMDSDGEFDQPQSEGGTAHLQDWKISSHTSRKLNIQQVFCLFIS